MQPPHRSTDEPEPQRSQGQRALRNLGLFVAAVVVVLIGGLAAGYLYAKGAPERAAGSMVSQFVQFEENRGDQPPIEGDPAPTSGAHDGRARCGRVSGPVGVDDQLATLATGAVIVQYDPDVVSGAPVLDELASRGDVLVAPNPAIDRPVVATAWTQRMELPEATAELLFAFVTAHRGIGPDAAAPCPAADGQ